MPPVSPRTQALMQPPATPEDARMAFEDGFSQMAQNVLTSKFPDLLEQVVTFKVLSSDLDTGSAVGAFIIDQNGTTVHVPTILANNQIKPLEIMYIPDKDLFLPLQRPWMEQIDHLGLNTMGSGVKPPKTLATDIDIRNLVVPPSSGRVAYASYEPGQKLAEFLERSPNYVKKAFQLVLENYPGILKFAYERLNLEDWMIALKPYTEKTAAALPNAYILTVNDGPERFREVFGKEAGAAFQKAAAHGYVVKDNRPYVKLAVQTEEPLWSHEAKAPGFYRLCLADGGTVDAAAVPNPLPLVSPLRYGKTMGATPLPDPYTEQNKPEAGKEVVGKPRDGGPKPKYLIITADHKFSVTTHAPIGEMLAEQDVAPALLNMLKGENGLGAGYGTFVRYEAGKLSAMDPFRVANVSTDSKGVRRIKTDTIVPDADAPAGPRYIVTDPNSAIRQVVSPKESNVTYVPTTFKFIRGEYGDASRFAESAEVRLRANSLLSKVGSVLVKVADVGGDMVSIGGMDAVTKLGALHLLIHGLHLREKDAVSVLEKTAANGSHDFYVVNPASLFHVKREWDKTAQGMMLPPPGAMGGMPPEMAGGMMPPAPPDPVAIAVTEIGSQLTDQAAAVAEQLAEQQRDLSNQLKVLDAVQQRAQEVAMGQMGAGTEAPPEVAGPPVGAQVAPPGAMPPGAMPPEAMPPGGMEGPASAEMMADQAAPMMGEAAALEDPEAFEATAIGSLASNPDLRGLVADYMPTLETALDNLARILTSLWIEEDKFRAELGENDYAIIEDKLRMVFNNLGSLVLKINQTVLAAKPEDEMEA